MGQQIGRPHRVVHIGLAARHVLDVHRIGKHQLERLGENRPDRLPIDPRRPHRNVADRMARQPARQSLQFRSRRAKRLDLLLNLTAAGQTAAGETDTGRDTVTVDIETGTTRMKYLHDPLPRSGAGEEPTKSNSRMRAPALAGVATVRGAGPSLPQVSSDAGRGIFSVGN